MRLMNELEAGLICEELLFQLMRAKKIAPDVYEYFATEMDLEDEEFEAAYKFYWGDTNVC